MCEHCPTTIKCDVCGSKYTVYGNVREYDQPCDRCRRWAEKQIRKMIERCAKIRLPYSIMYDTLMKVDLV